MKRIRGTSICLAATLLIGLGLQTREGYTQARPPNNPAQTNSPDQVKEQLEQEYIGGMAALNSRDWTRAIYAFEKIVHQDPNFRDTKRRLRQAQYGLRRENNDVMLARHYAEGVSAINRNDLGAALVALQKVHQINPKYRDVAALLTEVENTLRAKTGITTGPLTAIVSPAYVDSLYRGAVAFYEREDWLQAIVELEKIQMLQPAHPYVEHRLNLAREKLKATQEAANASKSRRYEYIFFIAGSALAVLIVLPLIGAIAFSRATRARVYLLRGNYPAAVKLYEKILDRNPKKVKIYPALANIYLLLGRYDEKAMKIYKTVLQLNLATHHQDEINALVAQNYLTEGRTDADAIQVLENALKVERQKLGHGAK